MTNIKSIYPLLGRSYLYIYHYLVMQMSTVLMHASYYLPALMNCDSKRALCAASDGGKWQSKPSLQALSFEVHYATRIMQTPGAPCSGRPHSSICGSFEMVGSIDDQTGAGLMTVSFALILTC